MSHVHFRTEIASVGWATCVHLFVALLLKLKRFSETRRSNGFSPVCTQVCSVREDLTKPFLTNVAGVLFLSSVRSRIWRQVSSHHKRLEAEIARIWLLTSVDSFVHCQGRFVPAVLRANTAGVRCLTGVQPCMVCEATFLPEAFLTNIASIWSRTCVFSHDWLCHVSEWSVSGKCCMNGVSDPHAFSS